MSGRGRLAGLAAGLIAAAGSGVSSAQRNEPPVVVLDVIVTDANGAPVPGLTTADFDVVSDSRAQTISFVTSDPQPLSVVFLVDVSASATGLWRPNVSSVVSALGGALRPGDRARLVGLAGSVTLGPWAADSAALLPSVATVLTPSRDDQFGPSPIWDAVDSTLEALAAEPGRRTIMLLTDGLASGNVHGVDEVAAHAAAVGVPVNVIAGWSGVTGVAGTLLKQLTTTSDGLAVAYSGGPVTVTLNRDSRAITGLPAMPLAPLVDKVLSDLRVCYRVGFIPDRADGTVRVVTVGVKRPGLKVRTRAQYVAGSPR